MIQWHHQDVAFILEFRTCVLQDVGCLLQTDRFANSGGFPAM